jgi:hypothetical protein
VGAETSPSYDSNHINEALNDLAFVQAVKAAKEKQQLQQLNGIVETKESVAKEKKALPKYALDPKLPKVRTMCIPIGHPRRLVSFILPLLVVVDRLSLHFVLVGGGINIAPLFSYDATMIRQWNITVDC